VPLRNDHDLKGLNSGVELVSRASKPTVDLEPTSENVDRYSASSISCQWGESMCSAIVQDFAKLLPTPEPEGQQVSKAAKRPEPCQLCKKLGVKYVISGCRLHLHMRNKEYPPR